MFHLSKDLMHPRFADEKGRHKKKRLVQSPNSYFMDVKCMGRQRGDPPAPHISFTLLIFAIIFFASIMCQKW